jgi:hypothetical protein
MPKTKEDTKAKKSPKKATSRKKDSPKKAKSPSPKKKASPKKASEDKEIYLRYIAYFISNNVGFSLKTIMQKKDIKDILKATKKELKDIATHLYIARMTTYYVCQNLSLLIGRDNEELESIITSTKKLWKQHNIPDVSVAYYDDEEALMEYMDRVGVPYLTVLKPYTETKVKSREVSKKKATKKKGTSPSPKKKSAKVSPKTVSNDSESDEDNEPISKIIKKKPVKKASPKSKVKRSKGTGDCAKYKLDELKEMAKKRGIKYSGLKKQDLCDKLGIE